MKHTVPFFCRPAVCAAASGLLLRTCWAARHRVTRTPAGAAAGAGRVAYLYQPTEGVIADVIPYYWQGRFHLMHLQLKPGQKGWDWAQLVTRDFVAFEHTGVAIPGGGTDDARDRDIFTGSVFEKEGRLFAFYCGHNDVFAKQQKTRSGHARFRSLSGLRVEVSALFCCVGTAASVCQQKSDVGGAGFSLPRALTGERSGAYTHGI